MNVSIDISLYPLNPEYKAPILNFINAMRARQKEGYEMKFNPLSTQLYGSYSAIWKMLGEELPKAFGAEFTSVAVIKVVSLDVTA